MTGRNLQEEAGPGKGVGGGCKTPKERAATGDQKFRLSPNRSRFSGISQNNINQPTNKQKIVSRREEVRKNPGPGECGS